ncbi:ribosome maturation factor RimM [Desulfotomaculum copahuensis]|uniref:Ribosome maturation factor RimM n=1 Tax=Desulfotomaculum copahuensis TaxID=1838280 RepID=A0A1B7LB24_9FIRM|nr:ribosome maturation factor RimM [Desulfotomaculum copahuensis]OAT79515.1 16S rRNA processing protein RimM [Desulfotomaculum copahuensis]
MLEEYITIGKIVNTQGNRGQVRVVPLTDFPERFAQMEQVLVARGESRRLYHIETVGYHKRFVIVKFAGVPDMNAAQALKGALLQVTRDQLVPLPADTYYVFDIIGLRVYTGTGEYLGTVRDVLANPAHDVYVVQEGVKPPLLVPARKEMVREIDLPGKRMVVALPAGLRD